MKFLPNSIKSILPSIGLLYIVQLASVYLLFGSSILILNTMAEQNQLSKSIGDFSSALYQNVIADKKGNIIMSPLSVQIALSLVHAGANGITAEVLSTGLKLTGQTKESIASNFHNLLTPLQNDPMLKIANSIYVMQGYQIETAFHEIATKQYYSSVDALDFADNVNAARTINTWVEQKTNDKIKDLISSDALDSLTRLVLVNAIYFKGQWKHQFRKSATMKEPFYTDAINSIEVDMMHVKDDFNYGYIEALNSEVIELPYNNSDVSMMIILPKERDGLAALEVALQSYDINSISGQLYQQKVDVSLPKFKIEFEISLPDTLKKMGMENIFSDFADFSGLLKAQPDGLKEPLKVSDVIHKAFIDVNEEGAEAAAATAVNCRRKRDCPALFTADHPFFYVIHHHNENVHNCLLFLGTYQQSNNIISGDDDIHDEL